MWVCLRKRTRRLSVLNTIALTDGNNDQVFWSGLPQTAQPLNPGGSLWIPSRKCQMDVALLLLPWPHAGKLLRLNNVAEATTQSFFSVFVRSPERKAQVTTSFAPWLKLQQILLWIIPITMLVLKTCLKPTAHASCKPFLKDQGHRAN